LAEGFRRENGECLAAYRGYPCSAKTVAFSKDETLVAAGY
jgi:hypothetical protein